MSCIMKVTGLTREWCNRKRSSQFGKKANYENELMVMI